MRAQFASNLEDPEATCTRIGIITAKVRGGVLAHREAPVDLTLRRKQKSFRRAVDRNLLRRRIRDVFRRNKSVWPERVDMVIVLLSGGARLCAFSPLSSRRA